MRRRLVALVIGLVLPTVAAANEKIAVIPTQLEKSASGQVPALFDDYLLTSVQNISGAEVIGQDDISTVLGFEKQKDLVNCNDTSCIADIGGALGVDKIVAVKIARLGNDWVATGKLINIKTTRVESRVNEIIAGDTRALLTAVGALVAKIFGKTAPPANTAAAPPSPAPSPAVPATAQKIDPSAGRGSRIVGTVMLLGGLGVAVLGGITIADARHQTCDTDPLTGYCDETDGGKVFSGALLVAAGLVLEGVGSKVRANGVARGRLGTDDAVGQPPVRWLGWLLAGLTMGMPLVGTMIDDGDTAQNVGWGTGIGASLVFVLGGFVGVDAGYTALPQPLLRYAEGHHGNRIPITGLAWQL